MLQRWIADLAAKAAPPLGRRGGENPARTLDKDSTALLVQAVTEFFRNKPVLSREEFQQMVEERRKAGKDAEAKVEAPKPA